MSCGRIPNGRLGLGLGPFAQEPVIIGAVAVGETLFSNELLTRRYVTRRNEAKTTNCAVVPARHASGQYLTTKFDIAVFGSPKNVAK